LLLCKCSQFFNLVLADHLEDSLLELLQFKNVNLSLLLPEGVSEQAFNLWQYLFMVFKREGLHDLFESKRVIFQGFNFLYVVLINGLKVN